MILIRREGLKILVFDSAVKRNGDVEIDNFENGVELIENIVLDILIESREHGIEAINKLELLMEEKK